MKNQFYFKKKAGILLLSLCAAVGLCAQNPIVVLEAENADSVHAPAKVKSVDGFSGGKYVGGNDPGSYLFFHDVEMDEAGTYEFKTYFNFVDRCRFHGFEPTIASTTMDQMVIYTQVLHRNWIGISADMPNIPLDYPGVSLVPFDLEEFPWQLSFIAAKSRAFSARDYLVQDAFVRLFA